MQHLIFIVQSCMMHAASFCCCALAMPALFDMHSSPCVVLVAYLMLAISHAFVTWAHAHDLTLQTSRRSCARRGARHSCRSQQRAWPEQHTCPRAAREQACRAHHYSASLNPACAAPPPANVACDIPPQRTSTRQRTRRNSDADESRCDTPHECDPSSLCVVCFAQP